MVLRGRLSKKIKLAYLFQCCQANCLLVLAFYVAYSHEIAINHLSNIDRWVSEGNILSCWFWYEIFHTCNPKAPYSKEFYSLPADTEQMLLNHPIDYLLFVCVCLCVCGVWWIARGGQVIHVNGTLCQLGRLLIHQALLYQTIHSHTCTYTHTHTQAMHSTHPRHKGGEHKYISQSKGAESDWTQVSWRMECVYIRRTPWMEQDDGDYYH